MESRRISALVCAAVMIAAGANRTSASTITQWSFDAGGTVSAPDNSPTPTTGSGVATILGMTNTYNGGNTASADVLSTSGTANTGFTEFTWRIRGAQTPTGNNGWATHAAGAPQYSQGIELDASTLGHQNIKFSFDWYSTTQGIRDLQFQYNTNTANSAGWTNFGGTSPKGTYIAVSNDWYNAPGTNTPMITVDLSSITGANNDANFGIRLVSAFDSTGNVPNDFASAKLNGTATQIYNNNSGNWRFDNLTFSGDSLTATPEPATMLLMLVGIGGGLVYRKRIFR